MVGKSKSYGRCEPHGQWWEVRAARAMVGAMGGMGVVGGMGTMGAVGIMGGMGAMGAVRGMGG